MSWHDFQSEPLQRPRVASTLFIGNKGGFCLIGQSNLEIHWLIYRNLVNSFEAREDDSLLCDPSMVVLPLSSFLFVYAIVTRFK